MTPKTYVIVLGLCATTGLAALAHEGVTNPAVMARMNGMKAVAGQMKTLGAMAKGQTAFDVATAQAAGTALGRHAAEVPSLFRAAENDPKSEAKPEIWTNWADFTEKGHLFEAAAQQTSRIASPEDLRSAMGALGQSCTSCHETYRIEK